MKKIVLSLSMIILAFTLLGCPSPIEPKDPVNYTVTYSTEHGTVPEPITVEEDTVLTAEQLKALTFEGFIFKGWFDGETEAKANEYTVTKDVTLTAKWEVIPSPAPKKYTVTFKTEHGTELDEFSVEENTVLTVKQLKALTFAGFIFKGWFDGETEAKAGEYKVTKDVELTAKWEEIPSPAPKKFTVTFKTEHGTEPDEISVEENTVLTAEQLKALTFEGFIFKGWFDGETEVKAGEYKVSKDVELTAKWENNAFSGSEAFPFEFGKVYSKVDEDKTTYTFVFNSDGTAKYEVLYGNELLEGYEYNYSVNTDTKTIYCNVEKWFFGGFNGVFSKWITLNEFADNYNNFLDENKLKAGILSNSYFREEIIDMKVSMKYGSDPDPKDAEEIEEYIAGITDDELWKTFTEVYATMLPKDMTVLDMFEKQKPQKENECKNIFVTIQKYEYEVDGTTGEPKSIKRVIYEEATLKDMISTVSCGEVNWQGNGDIDSIYIGGEFCYFLKVAKTTPCYPISEIKDGYIYIDNSFGIDKECKDWGYKETIDPIPYTEEGKGENLVVTITFDGSQYELKYHEKTTVIEFN